MIHKLMWQEEEEDGRVSKRTNGSCFLKKK